MKTVPLNTAKAWRAGVATDPGLERSINEDRVLADETRGVFLVVDGLGGHAAGEIAAETALNVIQQRLTGSNLEAEAEPNFGNDLPADLDPHLETAIRQAITDANNRIYELAEQHPECRGMACVLTVAIAQEDRVTIGHVGDSRLYLAWNGTLRKLTSDHSPVGELEDQGELTETEAMDHPRRNEVFRDVGSQSHSPDDGDFIETKSVLFPPDAALLLCSDGLSDALTSAQINGILEQYEGDPAATASQLIQAANHAGGKDNISAVFVPGADFIGHHSRALSDVRARHAVTRMKIDAKRWPTGRDLFVLFIGIVLGILLCGAAALAFLKWWR